jgi:hypothetical protein
MKPETALELQRRITNEVAGLKKVLDQLGDPDTATTMAGLKSGLTIAIRSLGRTNQALHDVVRAAATPPVSGNPFDRLFR